MSLEDVYFSENGPSQTTSTSVVENGCPGMYKTEDGQTWCLYRYKLTKTRKKMMNLFVALIKKLILNALEIG